MISLTRRKLEPNSLLALKVCATLTWNHLAKLRMSSDGLLRKSSGCRMPIRCGSFLSSVLLCLVNFMLRILEGAVPNLHLLKKTLKKGVGEFGEVT